MPLESDLTINVAKFHPAAARKKTLKFNEGLLEGMKGAKGWWEVGAAKYRAMRLEGNTSLPAPAMLEHGISITVPSRGAHSIPCRLFYPSHLVPDPDDPNRAKPYPASKPKTAGVILHIHGGGWVIGDHESTDSLLAFYANVSGCAVLSVGYRRAPEDPYPAAMEDCEDVGEWCVREAEGEFGGPLRFIGGESAGAHLSLLTLFHLLRTLPSFALPGGLLLHFGAYDLSELPSAYNVRDPPILTRFAMQKFYDAFLPGWDVERRKDPRVSPLYVDLEAFRSLPGDEGSRDQFGGGAPSEEDGGEHDGGAAGGANEYRKSRLPRALFTCGTVDPLLDDSVAMATKWAMGGGEQVLKIYPGAVHGFIGFDRGVVEEGAECLGDTAVFISDAMEGFEDVEVEDERREKGEREGWKL